MKFLNVFAAVIVLSTSLVGCGETKETHDHDRAYHSENGDLRETTASIEVLPAFLDDQEPFIRGAYIVASQHTDILDWIPCYCGCGEIAGHQSNKNCFIHEVKEDGSVVWDDHGTRCGVCMQIAVESAEMKKDGMSLKEIREAIDHKYGEGYGNPTPTPMPM